MHTAYRSPVAYRIPQAFLAMALGLLVALLVASPARADYVIGSHGEGAGQYSNPGGVAIDGSNGRLYVADGGSPYNRRVDIFETAGPFLFAFGWNVNVAAPAEALQTCTALSGCKTGSSGGGAGQFAKFGSPKDVAVDSASHDVYVSDPENNRIQKFDSEGNFLWAIGKGVNGGSSGKPNICTNAGAPTDVCKNASEGSGPGQFNEIRGVSVAPSGGNVYVVDRKPDGTCEIPGAINPKFIKRVQIFNSSGALVKTVEPTVAPCGGIEGFAVDDAGSFYLDDDSVVLGDAVTVIRQVRKYDATGEPIASWGEGGKIAIFSVASFTVDSANNLFAVGPTEGPDGPNGPSGPDGISEYDPSGNQVGLFFPPVTAGEIGIAAYHDAGGDLVLSEAHTGAVESRVLRFSLPDPGPLLVPGTTEASPIGSVKATLKTSFNSEGKASSAEFEYISKADYEAAGNSFGAGTQTTPASAPTPADFESHAVEATNLCTVPTEPSCLKPETTYYFRAKASNADGTVTGERAEFTTLAPIVLGETWATEVGSDSARLHAEANPLGFPATGRFQYIAEGADYQANGFLNASESTTVNFGSGEASVARAAQLLELSPHTTYHYRLIAENPYFSPLLSPGRTFATFATPAKGDTDCPNQTFRTGTGAVLPDCRAYELVSPLDKSNADILTLSNSVANPNLLDQSSTDGNAFAYTSYRAFADPKAAPYVNQFLATRKERGQPGEGWQTESLSPKGKGSEFFESSFKAFSPDLGSAWLSWRAEPGETPPDPCSQTGYNLLYQRDNSNGDFSALSCAPIEHSPPGIGYSAEVQGFSEDGARVVFRANEALTKDASGATTGSRPIYQLYMSTGAGQLRLISVLPDGEASEAQSSAGTAGETNSEAYFNINRFGRHLGAVSGDGKRVFWSQAVTGGAGPIYLRVNADQAQSKVIAGPECTQPAKACTIPVSGTVTPEPAVFEKGNPQGTKALFAIAGNGPLAGDLYRFDSEAQPPASELVAEGVVGSILGASEDLSRVYYASNKASTQAQGEGAETGKPNVYLSEGGETRFIATLTSGESSDLSNDYGGPTQAAPIFRTARVNADGGALVFTSNSRALSEAVAGYDNTDAVSGQPDSEVYRYEADADVLACLSCNPSGARPTGREIGVNTSSGAFGFWGAATVPRFQSQLFQPRYLADDGKHVFFNSFEALVLADVNGKQDVYEWTAQGAGGCAGDSAAYVESSAGCLSLISSGQSSADSELLDASPGGQDVFFTTAEGLVTQDYGLVDAYDAREGGGFPPPPSPPASCEGEACQNTPEPPNDPTPASAAFQGAGNVREEPTSARCAKGKVRRKARCVKSHKAKKKTAKTHRRASR
jgi:DNA-binding beta-propeller fold protein YncE